MLLGGFSFAVWLWSVIRQSDRNCALPANSFVFFQLAIDWAFSGRFYAIHFITNCIFKILIYWSSVTIHVVSNLPPFTNLTVSPTAKRLRNIWEWQVSHCSPFYWSLWKLKRFKRKKGMREFDLDLICEADSAIGFLSVLETPLKEYIR